MMKRISRRWTSAIALIMTLVMVFPMNVMAGDGREPPPPEEKVLDDTIPSDRTVITG